MKLYEMIMLEAKDEYVVKAFGPKIVQMAQSSKAQWAGSRLLMKKKPNDVIPTDKVDEAALSFVREKLIPLDPTPNQKYLVWIAKLYSDGKLKEEDFYKVPESLALFNKVQTKLAQKDIMQYKSLQDLFKAVEPFEDAEEQKSGKEKRKEERAEAIAGTDLVYDTADFKMYRLNTQQAACEVGRGTKWCTAATKSHNYFEDYTTGGTLYAVIPTKPINDAPFQMYFPNSTSEGYDRFQAADKYDDSKGIDALIGVLPSLRGPILDLFKLHKSPITENFAEIFGADVVKKMPVESRIPIAATVIEEFFDGYPAASAADVNKILQGSFTPKEIKTILAHPKITGYLIDAVVDADSPMSVFKNAAKIYGGIENVKKAVRKLSDKQYQEMFTSLLTWQDELPSKAIIDKILEFVGKSRKQMIKYLMEHQPSNTTVFKWMLYANSSAERALVAELNQTERLSVIEAVAKDSLSTLLNVIKNALKAFKSTSLKTLTPKEIEALANVTVKAYRTRKAKLPKDLYMIRFLPTLKELNEIHIKLVGEKINTNFSLPNLTTREKAEGRLIQTLGQSDFDYEGIEWYEVNGNSLVRALGRGLPAPKDILESTLSTGFLTPREKSYMLLVVSQGLESQAWLTVIPYGKEDARTVFANTEKTRLYSYEKLTLNDAKLKSSMNQIINYVRDDVNTGIEIDATEFRESKQ